MIPDNQTLNQLWNVSNSDSLESGTEPHVIFAKLLYNRIIKTHDNDTQRKESITEET